MGVANANPERMVRREQRAHASRCAKMGGFLLERYRRVGDKVLMAGIVATGAAGCCETADTAYKATQNFVNGENSHYHAAICFVAVVSFFAAWRLADKFR